MDDSEMFDDSPMGDFGFGGGFGGDMTVEEARKLHAIFTAPTAAEAYRVVADGQVSTAMLDEDEKED